MSSVSVGNHSGIPHSGMIAEKERLSKSTLQLQEIRPLAQAWETSGYEKKCCGDYLKD
jgi:hypothetical protein